MFDFFSKEARLVKVGISGQNILLKHFGVSVSDETLLQHLLQFPTKNPYDLTCSYLYMLYIHFTANTEDKKRKALATLDSLLYMHHKGLFKDNRMLNLLVTKIIQECNVSQKDLDSMASRFTER